MLNPLRLLVRGVKEIGLRPTLDAVAYQIRLAGYRIRFGSRWKPMPEASVDWRRPGRVTGWRREGQTVTVACAEGAYAIRVLAPDVIRVCFRPSSTGPGRQYSSYAVVRPDDAWPSRWFDVDDLGPAVELRTGRLRCRIEKGRGLLTFLDSDGRLINADGDGIGWHGEGQVICHKRIQPDEHFYGLGERTAGLDRRGGAFETWNSDPQTYEVGQDPIYLCVPFLLGLHSEGEQGYGIFFDNTFRGRFDLGARDPQVASFGARGGAMCYTFMYGPALTDVLARYTALTGRQTLPPLWALGYHQSRWSYYPAERVRRLARDFRERHDVPCDAIHLDIDAMDGYRCFTWDEERFADPAGMIADLHRQGFKVVTIVDAGIKVDPDYPVYRDGLEQGIFCALPDGRLLKGPVWPGNCVFPDFTARRVRDWWGDLVGGLLSDGVDGLWNDMNEPAIFGLEGTTMPDAVRHELEGRGGDHAEAHNVYGMQMARATAEGMMRCRPDERPLVITRSGWAGVQRYAVSWTGDNRATWEQLRLTIPMVANLGLSGVAFTGPDTGGFLGHPSAELFTRWLQMSVFLPFFRAHTYLHDPDQEPWTWGEPTLGINRRWIEHRYRLLPYLYTALWQCAQTGVPPLRPLFLGFQDEPGTHKLEDQFMCGDHLLIAPVMEEGATTRGVSLPVGPWYDVWRDELVWGPIDLEVGAPLERIPIFARAGAVIPTGPVMRYVSDRPRDPLTLHAYPPAAPGTSRSTDCEEKPGGPSAAAAGGGDPSGLENVISLLYEDDGRTYAYRDGEFLLTRFTLSSRGAGRCIELTRETEGAYRPEYRTIEIVVHGVTRRPDSVRVDGNPGGRGRRDESGRAVRLQLGRFGSLRMTWLDR